MAGGGTAWRREGPGTPMEVLAWGDKEMLCRPCVECGLMTDRFCDYCRARDRCPSEEWADGQMTPLCLYCDNKYDACHFCRGLSWCRPPRCERHFSTKPTSAGAASTGTSSAGAASAAAGSEEAASGEVASAAAAGPSPKPAP